MKIEKSEVEHFDPQFDPRFFVSHPEDFNQHFMPQDGYFEQKF